MVLPFLAQEISGLATQAYNSGAVNRKFINDVSGALWTKIEDIEGGLELDTPGNWTTITAGTGVDTFEGEIGVSGSTPVTVNVAGYSTISSQAKSSYDWFVASSSKLTASSQIAFYDSAHVDHDQTTNYDANKHVDHTGVSITAGNGLTGGGTIASTRDIAVGAGTGIGVNADDIEVLGYATISANAKLGADYVASGNEYSAAYNWYTESSSRISEFVASGDKYSTAYEERGSQIAGDGLNWDGSNIDVLGYSTISSNAHKAYVSAQALETGAFKEVNSGWASVADEDTIAHGLSAKPNFVSITPSGAVTFAVSFTCDATNITVRISAAGNRMVNWRAEV